MRKPFAPLLALACAALGACGDPDVRDLELCTRESYTGPAGQAQAGMGTICGLTGAGLQWQIAGPGPIYDDKKTFIALDQPIGKTVKAHCELRDGGGRIDDQWVWAHLVNMPGTYCKLKVR